MLRTLPRRCFTAPRYHRKTKTRFSTQAAALQTVPERMETASRLYVPGLDQHQTLPPPLARIPAPIGGVPSELDFAPSCLFVALYASLVPIALYRLFARSSRNLIVIFSLGFLVERCVRAPSIHPPLPLRILFNLVLETTICSALTNPVSCF